MATDLCVTANRLLAVTLVVCAMPLLSGCELQPQLLAAQSLNAGNEQIIAVSILTSDAKSIKTRQLYTWLVVVNCTGSQDRFPSEPYVLGQRVSDFRFPVSGKSVDLVAHVPANIYAKYSQPCAFLEGGGYFTGKIKSSVIPISKAQGTGPNNSFKPKPLRGSA